MLHSYASQEPSMVQPPPCWKIRQIDPPLPPLPTGKSDPFDEGGMDIFLEPYNYT